MVEVTELAATFDRLLDRLSQSLRREQRFTAEISHELRTPLAKILAEAEATHTAARDSARKPHPSATAERSSRFVSRPTVLAARWTRCLPPPLGGARWVPLDRRAHGRRACGRERGERRNRPRSRDSDRRAPCTAGARGNRECVLVEQALNANRENRHPLRALPSTFQSGPTRQRRLRGPRRRTGSRADYPRADIRARRQQGRKRRRLGRRTGPTAGAQTGPRRGRRYRPGHNRPKGLTFCPAPPHRLKLDQPRGQ